MVFGDNLSNPTGLAGPNWHVRFEDCERFIDRINAAKGKAEMLYPPKLGIVGNTHMIMQDRNSLADRRSDHQVDRCEREVRASER